MLVLCCPCVFTLSTREVVCAHFVKEQRVLARREKRLALKGPVRHASGPSPAADQSVVVSLTLTMHLAILQSICAQPLAQWGDVEFEIAGTSLRVLDALLASVPCLTLQSPSEIIVTTGIVSVLQSLQRELPSFPTRMALADLVAATLVNVTLASQAPSTWLATVDNLLSMPSRPGAVDRLPERAAAFARKLGTLQPLHPPQASNQIGTGNA